MEDIKLEPKKKNILQKVNDLFIDKKKRPLYVVLFILPFLIIIGIFGFITYREAKSLIDLATGGSEVNSEYVISSMGYTLRDNATEYQQECFAELKKAVESGADENTIVGLVAKNYVADFYTWTNKQGQYDIGGMGYVYSEKDETIEYKSNIYLKARDGFYKYLNEYINTYGVNNLIEVNNVNISKVNKNDVMYRMYEYVTTIQTGEDTWEKQYDLISHECFNVSLTWSYNPATKLDLSNFGTSINLLIIENDGRYEIVEASEKEINVRELEEDFESEQGNDDEQEEVE